MIFLTARIDHLKTAPTSAARVVHVTFRDITSRGLSLPQFNRFMSINCEYKFRLTKPIEPGEKLFISIVEMGRLPCEEIELCCEMCLDIVVTCGCVIFSQDLVSRNGEHKIIALIELSYTYSSIDDGQTEPLTVTALEPKTGGTNGYLEEITLPPVHGTYMTPQPEGRLALETWNQPSTSRDSRPYVEPDDAPESKMKDQPTASDTQPKDDTATGKGLFGLFKGKSHVKGVFTLKSIPNFLKNIRHRANTPEDEKRLLETPESSPGPSESGSDASNAKASDDKKEDGSTPSKPTTEDTESEVDFYEDPDLTSGYIQVVVTIIEAIQLAYTDVNPAVCVQVGDVCQYTSIKIDTTSPYYDETFTFNLHLPPIMMWNKFITLSVVYTRGLQLTNIVLGSFKISIGTVFNSVDHLLFERWAILSNPDDVHGLPMGMIKSTIKIVANGDEPTYPHASAMQHFRPFDLLISESATEHQVKYTVNIYKADGLPKMYTSFIASVKKVFTGQSRDLCDPFVEVSFAGAKQRTSVKKNNYSPVWNERVVFNETFPPWSHLIKIQLKDSHEMNVIGTYFINLKSISNYGQIGFPPTFGPTYIYLYGSPRDMSRSDHNTKLNLGLREGVSYRARMLISVQMEMMYSMESLATFVTVEPIQPINETYLAKNEEFFFFVYIKEANMISNTFAGMKVHFEVSIGNAGNTLDGDASENNDVHGQLRANTGSWKSTTDPLEVKATEDNLYYLPFEGKPQCMYVQSTWPDHRPRLYNSNRISNIYKMLKEGLLEVDDLLEDDSPNGSGTETLKSVLDEVSAACTDYIRYTSEAPPCGRTKLDLERQKLCVNEIAKINNLIISLNESISGNANIEHLWTAFNYLDNLKLISEDPQPSMPDVMIWMICGGKRLACYRTNPRHVIYSDRKEETGQSFEKLETIYLKWPTKRSAREQRFPATLQVYMWLGLLQDQKRYFEGLPEGDEIRQIVKEILDP